MAGNADLTGEKNIASQPGTAGLRPTCAHSSVFSPTSMHGQPAPGCRSWRRADARFANGGAIDRCIGAHFDVVFDNDDTRLDDLVVTTVAFFRVAKAVGTNLGPILQDDVIAELAIFANCAVGVRREVVADTRATRDMDKKDGQCNERR